MASLNNKEGGENIVQRALKEKAMIEKNRDRTLLASPPPIHRKPPVSFIEDQSHAPKSMESPLSTKLKKIETPKSRMVLQNAGRDLETMSLISELEFIKRVVPLCSSVKRENVGSLVLPPREWLIKSYEEHFPGEENLTKAQNNWLWYLLVGLELPLPVFVLPLKPSGATKYQLASSFNPEEKLQLDAINREKEEIQKRELEGVQFKTKLLTEATVGLQELKNSIEAEQHTNDDSNLPDEERLTQVGKELEALIGLVLDALIKSGQLSSRSKVMVHRILLGEPVTQKIMDQMDNYIISLLVNKLRIFSLEKKGKTFRFVLNDFSS